MPTERYRAKPSHHPQCRCSQCDRAARAATRAGELRQLSLEAGRKVAAAAHVARKEEEKRTALDAILADVQHTESRIARLGDAERKSKEDKRAARFVELRRQGYKSEDAFAQVEKEFGP